MTKVLNSLHGAPLRLSLGAKHGISAHADSRTEIPVSVTNVGDEAVTWSDEAPIVIGCRWYDGDKQHVPVEDLHTYIKQRPIAPGQTVEVPFLLIAPSSEGEFELQISLIMELVHWSADLDDADGTWLIVPGYVVSPLEWPRELYSSLGAKALRGSLAAAELGARIAAHSKKKEPQAVSAAEEEEESTTDIELFPARSSGSNDLAKDGLHHYALEQQQKLSKLRSDLAARDRRIQELEQQIRTVQAEKTALANRIDIVLQELKGGSFVKESIDTLRQLAGWATSTTGTLKQVIDWTATTSDIGEIAKVRDGVVRANQALSSILEQARQLSASEAIHHDVVADELQRLLDRQLFTVEKLGLTFVRNRYGLLAIQSDDAQAIAYYSSGILPEAGTIALLERFLKHGDTVFDVGANVGIYSLICAHLVGPSGKVTAVEPTSTTVKALEATLSVNGLQSRVHLFRGALGESQGEAVLSWEGTSGHNSLLPSTPTSPGQERVKVARGDDLAEDRTPDLVKIDVEGWELEVLRGFENTLAASSDVALIIEYSPEHVARHGQTKRDWRAALAALNRKIWMISDEDESLTELERDDQLGGVSCNLFLARELPASLEAMLRTPAAA